MKQPATNEQKLRRRLKQLFRGSGFSPEEITEMIPLIVYGAVQNAPALSKYLRSQHRDLFCDYCGHLHPLDQCTSPGVSDYRLDPTEWMRTRIPVSMQTQMAHLTVKKPRGSVQKLNKTEHVQVVNQNDDGK